MYNILYITIMPLFDDTATLLFRGIFQDYPAPSVVTSLLDRSHSLATSIDGDVPFQSSYGGIAIEGNLHKYPVNGP